MNMHSLPAGKVGEHQARIALGWNQPLDEYYAEVYAVQPNGKLGALPCATLDESFFPSDILQLTAWLSRLMRFTRCLPFTRLKSPPVRSDSPFGSRMTLRSMGGADDQPD
jgi:hypothetical protein